MVFEKTLLLYHAGSAEAHGRLPEEGEEEEKDREDRQHIHNRGEDDKLLRQARMRGLRHNQRAGGRQLRQVLLRHLQSTRETCDHRLYDCKPYLVMGA